MKKIFSILAIVCAILSMSSCKTNSQLVVWNATVNAQGEGKVNVTFPTGGFVADGNATVTVHSTNDTTAVPAVLFAEEVLANPKAFTAEQVKFAKFATAKFEDAYSVTEVEGTWSVDIEAYALQPETGLYIVIKKHWPEEPQPVDSVAVVPADSSAVK